MCGVPDDTPSYFTIGFDFAHSSPSGNFGFGFTDGSGASPVYAAGPSPAPNVTACGTIVGSATALGAASGVTLAASAEIIVAFLTAIFVGLGIGELLALLALTALSLGAILAIIACLQ
jgi:hypothetical protein